jgi:hypothetical protein
MNFKDAEAWFDDLSGRRALVTLTRSGDRYATDEAAAWMAEAETAVASVFPAGHAARFPFLAAEQRAKTIKLTDVGHRPHFESIAGAFEAARLMLKAGNVRGVAEAIQATTVGELLDQARSLLGQGYVLAATVVAGGALETHLLHLCQRSGLTRSGDGSISKYNGAIGAARNQGNTTPVYSANDAKAVEAWGGVRNEAAHSPSTFNRPQQEVSLMEVSLMIEGISQFLARTP